jgi:hypothetical protein
MHYTDIEMIGKPKFRRISKCVKGGLASLILGISLGSSAISQTSQVSSVAEDFEVKKVETSNLEQEVIEKSKIVFENIKDDSNIQLLRQVYGEDEVREILESIGASNDLVKKYFNRDSIVVKYLNLSVISDTYSYFNRFCQKILDNPLSADYRRNFEKCQEIQKRFYEKNKDEFLDVRRETELVEHFKSELDRKYEQAVKLGDNDLGCKIANEISRFREENSYYIRFVDDVAEITDEFEQTVGNMNNLAEQIRQQTSVVKR